MLGWGMINVYHSFFLSHRIFNLVISSLLLVLRYATRTTIRGACTWHSDVKFDLKPSWCSQTLLANHN
jgi:hypothetical protein